jgi:hypothetical protein
MQSPSEVSLANGTAVTNRLPAQEEVKKDGGLVVIECQLTGITPMLQNAMSNETLLALWTKEKEAKNSERPDPRDYANGRIHRLEDGRACVPNPMLYASFKAAGVYVRLDGRRMLTSGKSSHLPSMLTILTEEIPIYLPGTDQPALWEVDMQRGSNHNAGKSVAVCIIRPRFDKWELRIDLEIDRHETSIERMREVVEKAGRRTGLGDFRPGTKGIFGQFCITRWNVKQIVETE